jgi:hypothetical protein
LKGDDIEIARKFIEETDGATASFADAMRCLLFHKKKAVNPTPWNVDLSIGPNIKIPVSSYIRLKDETVINKWIKSVKDPVNMTASTTEGIFKGNKVFVSNENQIVERDAVIKGYYYGQQVIPFQECDKSLLYESGEKSLIVYGFTQSTNINWQNLNGDSLAYVFGRKGDKKAEHALRCLVECLHEMELVAIVRRVYNRGNAPKMYALMPVIDSENYICLSMVGLCYKDDIKCMSFPPTNLKKHSCTNEQVNAFKDLIAAMDLTKAYDESFDDAEAFPVAETVSPSVQYILDCIAFRAMNPEKPLPPPRDDIMMLFKVPPIIENKAMKPLENLKNLFSLTKIQKKTRVKNNNLTTNADNVIKQDVEVQSNVQDIDMPVIQLPVTKNNAINKIGTLDPVSDFKTLIQSGKVLADLSSEMVEAIEILVYCNLDGTYSKAVAAMKFFREECVKTDPSPYNSWLQRFKKALDDRQKRDMLLQIENDRLDLILKEENESSNFENTHSADSQMYDNDTIPNATELIMDAEMNDLFDEM